MFPLKDDNPSRTLPVVTYLIIAANVYVFLLELSVGPQHVEQLLASFGLIPAEFLQHFDSHQVARIYTSMFTHGGLVHLVSNMWMLFIFGDNVEDRMGHAGFAIFYLLCGTIAALAQVFSGLNSVMPVIGASGAIAGVLGAYLVLFPRACVITFIPLGFVPLFYPVPAFLFVIIWAATQFLAGMVHLALPVAGVHAGAVAYWAHIGGFLSGILLVKAFTNAHDYEDWYPDEYLPY